jgi:hypothetical protein
MWFTTKNSLEIIAENNESKKPHGTEKFTYITTLYAKSSLHLGWCMWKAKRKTKNPTFHHQNPRLGISRNKKIKMFF